MSELIDSQHGPTTLIAGLIVVLALHFFLKLIEMILPAFKKKIERTDQMGVEFIRFEYELQQIREKLTQLSRIQSDCSRILTGLRVLAGERWPEIRKAILEDDLSS